MWLFKKKKKHIKISNGIIIEVSFIDREDFLLKPESSNAVLDIFK